MSMRKKILATLLAMTMAIGMLAGCGGGSSSGSSDAPASSDSGSADAGSTDGAADTSKEVNLVMYVISDRPAGQDVVDENLNKLLKEKLNCTLTINWIGWAEYANKYPLLFSSGEEFDIAYCATWLNFANLARRGAFKSLDELLPTYAPDNYALQSQTALQQATIDGHIYAVPTLLPTYITYGSIYRGDLAKEAGMTDTIDTWEEVEQFGDWIKANHPEMEVIDEYSSGPELSLVWERMAGNYEIDSGNRYIFYDPSEEEPKVFAIYDDPTIGDFYEMCYRFGEKGFWSKSALSDTDSSKTQNGKAAIRFHNVDTWSGYTVLHPEWDFQYGVMTGEIAHLPYTQDCMVISNTSKNPERAMMFWNLLTTDQEVYDALYYGVLGTTYELNEEGQFTILDTDLYATSAMWAARTFDLNRNQAGVPESYDTMRAEWEEQIQDGVGIEKYTGFVLDTTNITTEIANCQNVRQQYGWPLELGYTDPVAGLEEYKQKLQEAGIEKVLAECQAQLDAYRTSLG